MPPGSALIPSKAALRVLRSIAYATSAGTALIIEERRRRISSLQKVCDNAKRLKSCQRYHPSTLEENDDLPLAALERLSKEPRQHIPKGQEMERIEAKRKRRKARLRPVVGVDTDVDTGGVPHFSNKERQPLSPVEKRLKSIGKLRTAGLARIDKECNADFSRVIHPAVNCNIVRPRRELHQWNTIRRGFLDAGSNESVSWFGMARQLVETCATQGLSDIAHRIRVDLVEKPQFGFRLEVDRLLEANNVDEALDMFDWLSQSKSITFTRGGLRAIDRLFQAAVEAQKCDLAELLLRRMHSFGRRDLAPWLILLAGYDRRRDYEAVLRLYQELPRDYKTHGTATTIALRALTAQSYLEEAETLLNAVQQESQKCLSSCFTTLLGGVWRKTKDLNKTISLFERMEARWFTRYLPSCALFNALIQACVEAGRLDLARLYKDIMKAKYGLDGNAKTDAHSIFILGKEGDWNSVEAAIEESVRKRGTPFSISDFNALLRQRLITMSLANGEDFLVNAIDNRRIKPDILTMNIIINACLEAGDINSSVRWITYMHTVGLEPDAVTFNTILHKLWKHSKVHHNELFPIYQKVRRLDRSLINGRTEDILRFAMAYDTHHKGLSSLKKSKSKNLVRQKVDTGTGTDLEKTHVDMIIALSVPEYEADGCDVLRQYETTKAKGALISPGMFETIYSASLKLQDGKELRQEILKSANQAGVQVTTLIPLRIRLLPKRIQHIYDYLDRMYWFRDRAGLPVEHFTAVTAAHKLLQRKRPQAAAYLLLWVSQSEWGQRKPLDIVGLTVAIDAFAAHGSIQGVNSVVQQVIERGILIDSKFLERLKVARNELAENERICQSRYKEVVERELAILDQLTVRCCDLFTEKKLKFREDAGGFVRLIAQGRGVVVPGEERQDVQHHRQVASVVGDKMGHVDLDFAPLGHASESLEEATTTSHLLVEDIPPKLLVGVA